ncbi:MAG: ATP-binding cassette domain-containing protein [Geminicoccaceae bacterium]|nr:ATP-binding cassette domain-containing protein [Geminicoccaceae bacterium]MCX8102108.1 ATP-binding cassette domain-containing protein [Geminicoccaceae bacterium]
MRYGSGEEVLRDIGLSINAGSFHYLMGPSGAGKTSLLRLLSLSQPASRGTVVLFGRDVARVDRDELGRLRRRIGVVFQDFRLLDHLTAFDNVALPLRIGGADPERISAYVSQMLCWIGLGDFIEARPPQLSMGQRQLLAVARAVVGRPDLLLADEPTSNVDPARAERLVHLFAELHKLGTAVVLATHSRELVRRWPFPVLHMERGRLIRALPAEPRAAVG